MASSLSDSADPLVQLASALEAGGGQVPASGDEVAMIGLADQLVKSSEARLGLLVAVARRRGVSWQSIGASLGVSRQAAFTRFSHAVEDGADRVPMIEPTVDLMDRTVDIFQSLAADDYETVRGHMTYTCARALPKRRLMGVWKEVVTASGALEVCTDATVQTPDGRTPLGKLANRHLLAGAIVQTTLRHEAGEWIGRVAYNGAGKVTGVLIAPPGAQNLPF